MTSFRQQRKGIPDFGAFVISLDLELHWGWRDEKAWDGDYSANFLGVWEAVPRLLGCFGEMEIAATWAVVGFLFAESRMELDKESPRNKPTYHNPRLNPYLEDIGEDEEQDPFHFCPTLLRLIKTSLGQEIGSHTFSHYFCLEPGQDAVAFRADLESAIRIARARGIQLRSIVFPRNQHNPDYLGILAELGILCYRDNTKGWMHRASKITHNTLTKRLFRLVDAHFNLSGQHTARWPQKSEFGSGVCPVPTSFFLTPVSGSRSVLDWLRLRRIKKSMLHAAKENEIFHLWWHPHNFGVNLEQNISYLTEILEYYQKLKNKYGMRSLNMAEIAEIVLRLCPKSCISERCCGEKEEI